MATMIEKMAQALVDEAKRQNPEVWADWSTDDELEVGGDERAPYRIWSQHAPWDMLGLVRAALTAMLEPTEGMVDAYYELCDIGGDLAYPNKPQDGFNAMIQAALDETTTPPS